jgi:hypothetical protein
MSLIETGQRSLDPEATDGISTSASPEPWRSPRITALEADLAYFQARMELIGAPVTSNQKAQIRTFRHLYQALERIVARLHRGVAAA